MRIWPPNWLSSAGEVVRNGMILTLHAFLASASNRSHVASIRLVAMAAKKAFGKSSKTCVMSTKRWPSTEKVFEISLMDGNINQVESGLDPYT